MLLEQATGGPLGGTLQSTLEIGYPIQLPSLAYRDWDKEAWAGSRGRPRKGPFLARLEIQRTFALWTSLFHCANQSCEMACFAGLVGEQRLEA